MHCKANKAEGHKLVGILHTSCTDVRLRERKCSLTCDLWLSCWLMARRSSSCCRSSTRASCFSQMSFSSIFMDSSISCFIPICTSSSFSTSCTEISFNFRCTLHRQKIDNIKYRDRRERPILHQCLPRYL